MEAYSLLELNRSIKQKIKNYMPGLYWIVAEINELQVNSSGHCFIELIEKAVDSEHITAKARATIWAYQYRMIAPYFETMTGRSLSAGLKIMLQASVEFHEIFGMNLHVADVNPAFTIGDLAVHRQAIIKQLKEEGVFDMNHELEIPVVSQRIAVISSENAAGYGDFVNQLYASNYAFSHKLFRAVMQGNEAESSIIDAFEQIFEVENEFDIVVLIRGGGSQSDLNCFNSYGLAACIAQFSLPVITGIGHERDETVSDMVARLSLKTPTAVAEYLIHQAMLLDGKLQEIHNQMFCVTDFFIRSLSNKLKNLQQRLTTIIYSHARGQDKEIIALQVRLTNASNIYLFRKNQEIKRLATESEKNANVALTSKKKHIAQLEEKISLLDPVNMLRRGYSITRANGKVVRNTAHLKKGQKIETMLQNGVIVSVVQSLS